MHATFWDFKKLKKMQKFNDEVYEHTLKLATLKIKDKHLQSRRYNQLVVAMWKYLIGAGNAWIVKLNNGDRNSFYEDKRMKKFDTLLNLFIKQTNIIKKEEPDAYEYFKNETDHFYLDSAILMQYSYVLLKRDLFKNKVLDHNLKESYNLSKFDETYCNNRYFIIMTGTINEITPYLENKFLPENVRIYIKNNSVNHISFVQDEMFSMCPNYKSIIFDLDGDGIIETTNIYYGVYFDHDGNGFAESSAWIGKHEGILIIDINNNDKVDNGSELITMDNISQFDINEDGIIDCNDSSYNELKILKGDGAIVSLSEAGILSINLNTTEINTIDENNNTCFAEGNFTRTNGETGKYGAYYLDRELSESIAVNWLEETDGIAELPDISGSGNIYSLHQTMLRDESGDLVA